MAAKGTIQTNQGTQHENVADSISGRDDGEDSCPQSPIEMPELPWPEHQEETPSEMGDEVKSCNVCHVQIPVADYQGCIDRKKQKSLAWKKKYEHEKKLSEDLKLKYDILSHKAKEDKDELNELQNKITTLNNKLSEVNEQLKTMKKEAKASEREKESLKNKIYEFETLELKLTQEKQKDKRTIRELEENVDSLKQTITGLEQMQQEGHEQEEFAIIRQKIEKSEAVLREELNKAMQDLESTKRENQNLQNVNEDKDLKIIQLERELQEKVADLDAIKNECQQLKDEKLEQKNRADEFEASNDVLQQRVGQFQKKLQHFQNHEQELCQARQKVADLGHIIVLYQGKVLEVEQLRRRIRNLEEDSRSDRALRHELLQIINGLRNMGQPIVPAAAPVAPDNSPIFPEPMVPFP
ncbi:tropomyosin-like [Dendronephthya gigantea]|uniref:tropomyosin-like n=1 Tax=Dendronephthya gigantea TaxID=151771 RepID=UPI00106C0F63|nr:tropomyosin-like [Dendronephthya gigantea]XP_028405122.1 tropomyosin-like [Dendronephthya gigantea]